MRLPGVALVPISLLALAPAEEEVKPGVLGFLVIAALGVMTYLLWRSMNHQLRKVDFEEPDGSGRPSEPDADDDPADRPPGRGS